MKTGYKILLNCIVFLLVAGLVGFLVRSAGSMITGSLNGEGYKLDMWLFLEWKTWAIGVAGAAGVALVWLLSGSNLDSLLMEHSGTFLGRCN